MKFKAVLFDLDQTLVDSRAFRSLRQRRDWKAIYPRIPELKLYPGISDLLAESPRGSIAIITTAPRPYVSRVVNALSIPASVMICYHDVPRTKPHPDPVLLALQKMNVQPQEGVMIGDSPDDVVAARTAGVVTVGAAWGSLDLAALRASKPDFLFEEPQELAAWLRKE